MKEISDFMRDPSHSPSIFPITLRFEEESSIECIGHILERWVQLQHVLIRLDQFQHSFKTDLQLLETLLRARDTVNGETGPNAQATWKICPNLQTIHFDVVSANSAGLIGFDGDLMYAYEQMARAVAFSRRRGPLERISWGVEGCWETFVTTG
jgi:hypothetical protein